MKKVNKDPFSNGDEHLRFEEKNCDGCIKSSRLKRRGVSVSQDGAQALSETRPSAGYY